jgi:hypothetical protein
MCKGPGMLPGLQSGLGPEACCAEVVGNGAIPRGWQLGHSGGWGSGRQQTCPQGNLSPKIDSPPPPMGPELGGTTHLSVFEQRQPVAWLLALRKAGAAQQVAGNSLHHLVAPGMWPARTASTTPPGLLGCLAADRAQCCVRRGRGVAERRGGYVRLVGSRDYVPYSLHSVHRACVREAVLGLTRSKLQRLWRLAIVKASRVGWCP